MRRGGESIGFLDERNCLRDAREYRGSLLQQVGDADTRNDVMEFGRSAVGIDMDGRHSGFLGRWMRVNHRDRRHRSRCLTVC